jgi:hypothetical protein
MLWIAAAAVAGYVALSLAAAGAQRPMLFPAPGGAREPVMRGATLDRIVGPNGTTVYALHAPAPAGAPTVVHFHGNGEQLADVVHLASALHAAGVGVYAVEYPGYGLAAATPATESALYAAAEAALAHLTEHAGVPRESIVLEGQSLGSGVATEMAARGHGARMVLLSPYTSIADLMSRFVPFLPSSLLVRDRFDNAAKAPRVGIPVLLVHGTDDALIPVEHGRRLARLFPAARLEELQGRHHNDLFAEAGSPLVSRIARFARGVAP